MIRIVGHRGARDLAPENTLVAIKKALEYAVDEIEIDIRVTKDNIPVLHHDPVLHDHAGNRMPIREHTLAQLHEHKPDLPTLAEAIRYTNRAVPLFVEVKRGEPVDCIVSVVESFLSQGWQPHDFLFSSKSQRILMQLKHALPEIEPVVIHAYSGVIATYRARQVGAKRLSMNYHFLWWGFIDAMYKQGFELYAYTLNDPSKAERWSKYGLAGVITDQPNSFRKKI